MRHILQMECAWMSGEFGFDPTS